MIAAGGVTVAVAPDSPGERATHTVTTTVSDDPAGASLDHLTLDYGDDGPDVSDVGADDVRRFGVDRDGDGAIDDSALGDSLQVSASNDGHTLTVQNSSGPSNLREGDTVILEIAAVRNPGSTGEYALSVGLNGADTATTSYRIAAATEATTATSSPAETASPTPGSTSTTATTPTATEASAPAATETATSTASETSTRTVTATATATASADDSDSGAAVSNQIMVASPIPASSFGTEGVALVGASAVVMGGIWLLKIQP